MQREISLRALENAFFVLGLATGGAVFCGSATVSSFLSSTTLTARTYGMVVSGALVLACAAKLLLNLAQAVRGAPAGRVKFAELRRMGACAGLMAMYCYGINNIGYFTSTTIFLFAMLLLLSSGRSWKKAGVCLVCSAGFNVLLFYLFQAMKVFMPATPLI